MVYGKKVPDSGFSGDDGSADSEVMGALRAYRAGRLGKSELVEALTNRRLLVAVIATVPGGEPVDAGGGDEPGPRRGVRERMTSHVENEPVAARPPGESGKGRVGVDSRADRGFPPEKATEIMLITIKATDGRVALPAFTSVDALSRWRAEARPVPASTQRVCAGGLAEGADLVVIDPAGPATVELSGAVLWALAEGRALVPLAGDPAVIGAIRAASEGMARAFSGTFVQPGADQSTDLVIQLVARDGAKAAELRDAASQLASKLAADPIMRSRVEGGVQIAVVNAAAPGSLRVRP